MFSILHVWESVAWEHAMIASFNCIDMLLIRVLYAHEISYRSINGCNQYTFNDTAITRKIHVMVTVAVYESLTMACTC